MDATDYGIVDLAGNPFTGAGENPVFTVDAVAPKLTTIGHNETAKTITFTFSEPVQFVDKTSGDVVASTGIPAILNIFGFDAEGNYNVGNGSDVPSTIVPGVTITTAVFDGNATANSGTVLVITYTGNLEKTADTNYVVDYWVPGVAYGAGQDIKDLAGNVIAAVGGDGSIAPVFTVDAVPPKLTALAPNATAKTITLTFSEAVHFETEHGNVVTAVSPAILNIFVATAGGD